MEEATISDLAATKSDYLAFDATSISALLASKLADSPIFTDTAYPGSNLSTIIDNISIGFGLLMWTLNQNVNESVFSEAQIYENINRIVKEISYNPLGNQTSLVPFSLTVTGLSTGGFMIPRYSYVTSKSGTSFSLREDLVFSKTGSAAEIVTPSGSTPLLYQGKYVEHPIITAQGIPYETFTLDLADDIIVDHFSIDVYVKTGGVWSKWTNTGSLFLNSPTDNVYELRFNENKKYTIKFGNGVNGQILAEGDSVAIYYLKSDGINGAVKASGIDSAVFRFDTVQLRNILADEEVSVTVLDGAQTKNTCKIANTSASTYFNEAESAASIKQNAPANFKSQLRVVTKEDYETFAKINFNNILHDVVAVNNDDYLSGYLKYFYDLGVANPHVASRPLFNQVNYSNANNFANVYLFCVDKIDSTLYLPAGLKSAIKDRFKDVEMLTNNLVLADPVFMAFGFGADESLNASVLRIRRRTNALNTSQYIQKEAARIISEYFSLSSCTLGQLIDAQSLANDILSIPGVESIATYDTVTGQEYNGLNLVMWDELYPEASATKIQSGIQLGYFQFPYWKSVDSIEDTINVL